VLLADGQDLTAALITMGVAIAIAGDRLVIARGGRMASRVSGDTTLSRTAQTRLRLIRRVRSVRGPSPHRART
jgi:hypothetical protein